MRQHRFQAQSRIADDRHIHIDVLADRRGIDIDMDDLRVRARTWPDCPSRDRQSERRQRSNNRIPARHSSHKRYRACPACAGSADSAHRTRPCPAAWSCRGCFPSPRNLSQCAPRIGDDRAAADVEHRLLATIDQLGRFQHLLGASAGDAHVLTLHDVRARRVIDLFIADRRTSHPWADRSAPNPVGPRWRSGTLR